MKICTKCKVKKSLDEFTKDKYAKDGRTSQCKKCKKTYWNHWYENKYKNDPDAQERTKSYMKRVWESGRPKRRTLSWKIKLILHFGGECSVCGYNKCISALEFHHKDKSKKDFTLRGAVNKKSWDYCVEEANKCIVVCSNCHRELHQLDGEQKAIKEILENEDYFDTGLTAKDYDRFGIY